MQTSRNPTGRPISTRQLAAQLSYSYEHLRKLVKGEALPSPELNNDVSIALGLDPQRMLEIAEREKIRRRFRRTPEALRSLLPPPTDRFAALWPVLSDPEKQILLQVAEAFAAAHGTESDDEAAQ